MGLRSLIFEAIGSGGGQINYSVFNYIITSKIVRHCFFCFGMIAEKSICGSVQPQFIVSYYHGGTVQEQGESGKNNWNDGIVRNGLLSIVGERYSFGSRVVQNHFFFLK
jgi:hypothetical protein